MSDIPTSVFADYRDEMFDRIYVEIRLTDRLAGGSPKDPKLVQGWLRKGMGITDQEELFHRTRQHLLEMGDALDEESQRLVRESVSLEDLFAVSERLAGELQTQGFKRDEQGVPYIEKRQIVAGIKESVNILYAGERWGIVPGYQGKGPKGFTAERVFVQPDRIPVGTANDVDVDLSIGHITGPRGPQATIGYYEYVERQTVAFELLQLRSQKKGGRGEAALSDDQWGRVWAHLELNGLGAMRSQGFGQFVVTRFSRDGS